MLAWQQAIAIQPHFPMAFQNLGEAYNAASRFEEAIPHFKEALRLDPGRADAYFQLSICLQRTGRIHEAIDAMQEAVRLQPDRTSWRYRLSALRDDKTYTAMPSDAVQKLFNSYAARYDKNLLEDLDYRAPQLLLDSVLAATARRDLDVLDLGCGTGLCGIAIRPYAPAGRD